MALLRPETPPEPPPASGGGELAPPATHRLRGRQRLLARLQRGMARLDHLADRLRDGWRRRFGHAGPLSILAYRGFGGPSQVTALGRVVEARLNTPPAATDSPFRNIVRVFRHFNTREVSAAGLELRLGSVTTQVSTDEEGYFRATLPVDGRPPGQEVDGWRPVDIEVVHCPVRGYSAVAARGEILVPPPDCELGIVSDID